MSERFNVQVKRRSYTASLKVFSRYKLKNPPFRGSCLVLSIMPCLCTNNLSGYTDLDWIDIQVLSRGEANERSLLL